jgi:hypothetical protein
MNNKLKSYYAKNVSKLGHNTCVVYANKYINNLLYSCKYSCNKYKIYI